MPANFGLKSYFLVSYSPSPSCIPNLKLLALTVAEINRGSQIFTCSPSQTPLILALKVVFGKLLSVPKLCKKNLAQCASKMTGTVCFEERTTICNAKFGDLGDNSHRGSKYVVESAIFWNRRPWFAYSLCNFYGVTMMIKGTGSLLLSAPIVKHFRSKKTVPFGPKFDGLGG